MDGYGTMAFVMILEFPSLDPVRLPGRHVDDMSHVQE